MTKSHCDAAFQAALKEDPLLSVNGLLMAGMDNIEAYIDCIDSYVTEINRLALSRITPGTLEEALSIAKAIDIRDKMIKFMTGVIDGKDVGVKFRYLGKERSMAEIYEMDRRRLIAGVPSTLKRIYYAVENLETAELNDIQIGVSHERKEICV